MTTVGLPPALPASLATLDGIAANRYPAVNWKADLRMSQREFTDYERLAQSTASVCTAVERYVMHSALAMRKLLVQQVLTDEVADANRPVLSYPCIRRPRERWYFENTVDMENLHHFVRHYDMQRPRRESLDLKRLADFLIHSFVFAVWPAVDQQASALRAGTGISVELHPGSLWWWVARTPSLQGGPDEQRGEELQLVPDNRGLKGGGSSASPKS